MQMKILLDFNKIEKTKLMPKASVKRLIECKKNDLINLVLDIEKYPKFVPFCLGSKFMKEMKRVIYY